MRFLRQKPMIYNLWLTQMFYIILVFVKIVFLNMDAFTKKLITYQSEHQSMVHLFICHQFRLGEYCLKLVWTFFGYIL